MVSPLPRYSVHYTGRTGFRVGWFRRLVMTIELKVDQLEPWKPPRNRDGSPNDRPDRLMGSRLEWRDMRLSDLPGYIAAVQGGLPGTREPSVPNP